LSVQAVACFEDQTSKPCTQHKIMNVLLYQTQFKMNEYNMGDYINYDDDDDNYESPPDSPEHITILFD
jgi:hypothetical protein